MRLLQLSLYNFRSYKDATFVFQPGINYICGRNAIGKTTILEAIHLLICGRSFRTSQNSELIRYGTPSFCIEALFLKHGVEQRIKFTFDGKQKKILVNQTQYSSYINLLGNMYGVIFTPDDVSLVKGGPGERRQFMDFHISQSDPLYVYYLNRYEGALRNRNRLLKERKLSAIFPWELEMASAAQYMTKKRLALVDSFSQHVSKMYRDISREEVELRLTLNTSLNHEDIRQFFLTQMEKNRYKEMEIGFTILGPHKDDLSLVMDDKEIKLFGSEGQQRSCVAALRFSSWNRLKEQVQMDPLMLVDDMGISLDAERKSQLYYKLVDMGQVFLTSTEHPNSENFRFCDQMINL